MNDKMEPSASTAISLSVVVTVYSETYSLVETIERILSKNRDYITEILLVISPKSSTECIDTCHQLKDKYDLISLHIQQQNPGVGWAIREGMELANGQYVALLSADLETEPEAIDRMVRKIEETKCDLVIGNRWLPGGGFKNYDPKKLILNWMFQHLFKILYFTKIGDLTYGYKIIKKDLIRQIQWEGTLHEIYIETTIKPLKQKAMVEQIPTIWIGRKEGESKNTFIKNFRYVALALKVWFRSK